MPWPHSQLQASQSLMKGLGDPHKFESGACIDGVGGARNMDPKISDSRCLD